MAAEQPTFNERQEIGRNYLRIAREDFERAFRVRNLHIKNARTYGLRDEEIASELGVTVDALPRDAA